MTARSTLVAGLREFLPSDVRVMPYAEQIDPPRRPTVMVRIDVVQPLLNAPSAARTYQFALVLIPTKCDAGPADDELDRLLEDVLFALESDASPLTWSRAERGTYQGSTYPAYEVTVSHHFPITP